MYCIIKTFHTHLPQNKFSILIYHKIILNNHIYRMIFYGGLTEEKFEFMMHKFHIQLATEAYESRIIIILIINTIIFMICCFDEFLQYISLCLSRFSWINFMKNLYASLIVMLLIFIYKIKMEQTLANKENYNLKYVYTKMTK